LVVEAFKGAKTTCFAYGQTGSGKTFTMMGTSDNTVPGLYVLAAFDVIELLQQYEDLEIYLSFYEIYCGKLYDLLNGKTEVQCREDAKHNVNIIGLTEKLVVQVEDIMSFISKGL
jgi:kinesin family protein 2/24